MTRMPPVMWDGMKPVEWGDKEEWNPTDFSKIYTTLKWWEFSNLNIEP